MGEVLRLSSMQECVIFLPPFNKNDDKRWGQAREQVMQAMKRIIMQPFLHSSTAEERDAAWASHLKCRETPRDGSVGYEFQVSVLATPQPSA